MESQKSPLSVFLTVVAQKLIDAGIGLTMHEIQLLLHPHQKEIAEAAIPITEDVVNALGGTTCPTGYIKNSKGECVPDVG